MGQHVPERDWKTFRKLKDRALDRYCRQALDEIAALCTAQEDGLSNHERYLQVFRRVQELDKDLSLAFDDPRRSTMTLLLISMRRLELLTDDELAQFSEGTLWRTRPLDPDEY